MSEVVYRKAPLVEAVAEFRFISGEPWDATLPGLLFSAMSSDFPKKSMAARFNVGTPPENPFPQIAMTELVRLSTEDERRFAQVAPNLLTVNCLSPYVGWAAFSQLIQRAFEAWVRVARPSGIQRLGLRYVNAISFAEETFELADFFNFYPFVNNSLPQNLVAAKAEVHVLEQAGRDVLSLRMHTVPPTDSSSRAAVVLDVDYHLNESGKVPLDGSLRWLDMAHERVLDTFRGCLTKALEDRFEPA